MYNISMLKDQFQEELKQAMLAKSRTTESLSFACFLPRLPIMKSIKVVQDMKQQMKMFWQSIDKQVKQRKDSIEQYEKAGRQELADKEKEEMAMLRKISSRSKWEKKK